jgi:AcrR family transcriptional regulator
VATREPVHSSRRTRAASKARPPATTRERLLEVSERLFAEKGIETTSLRTITREAGANLAAVNYHFGSKTALVTEVFARRIQPINEDRLRRLEEAEAESGGTPRIERILEALIVPALVLVRDPGGRHFRRLMGRAHSGSSQEVQQILLSQFERLGRRFCEAIERALPQLTPDEITWRFKFSIGAMAFVMVGGPPLRAAGARSRGNEPDETVTADLVAFLAAGFRAPIAREGRS